MESAGNCPGGLVCLTGGSGFIGSWLVRLLLDRGYAVRATVKNIQDERETKHLEALDAAASRLRLLQMDLLDPASVRAAVEGARGVFHLASPVTLQLPQDPEENKSLLIPSNSGIGRVVLMSSKAAMVPNPDWPADKVIDDDSWADVELLRKRQLWYNVSKTLAEKAAWDFAAKEGLQLVVINPGMVLGPFLTPSVNASLHCFLQLLEGQRMDLDLYMGCVDVRDVPSSLIALHESPSAQGRHLCMESVERLVDFTNHVADLFPELPVQRIKEDKQGWVVRAKDPSKKLMDLGIRFTPLDITIRDTVDCFRSKGLI
ncbi:hypothetical protein PVAP13_8NG169901 [Panicum virgatum]|uniref:NAD-dependent epimerase/dehydratase domain-containing protein n=1 Tax=Panicum virgatum TaxID=38727 RepID=A0A8T0P4V8_PANVG|nr:hypothetical protein PVAP13_8NG169901 [Panicum virgatum]